MDPTRHRFLKVISAYQSSLEIFHIERASDLAEIGGGGYRIGLSNDSKPA